MTSDRRTLVRVRAVRTSTAAVIGVALAVSLAACVNGSPHHTSSPSPSISVSPVITPSASATPTPTPTPTPTASISAGTPVTTKCSVVLTSQQVYDYNPNYVPHLSYTPAQGSLAAQAASAKGRVCEWINETSNSTIDVAVAVLAPSDLTQLKTSASAHGTMTTISGATGYFATSGSIGQLQVFAGTHWIVISSADFESAPDATGITQTVLGNLGLG